MAVKSKIIPENQIDDIIAVPLTRQRHLIDEGGIYQRILRELRGLGATVDDATPEQIWKAHRNVYRAMKVEHWAEAIYIKYFKDLSPRIPYE